jgi:hypothetical protein|tara:strand:- start:649 stop:918 length:270 start_codon:yes stop_codon:yes gene_type:complete
MPTNKQRVALSKQTTNQGEGRNALSFFVSGQTWNQEAGLGVRTSKQASQGSWRSKLEQTSKQAHEPLILSLWQSLTDKKLMAHVLACMG